MSTDDLFPYREKLRDDILAYRQANSISADAFALKVGVKPASLKSILYDSKRHVGIDFLKSWAKVSGHSVMEYIDDPGNPVPGIPQQAFAEATDQQRVWMRAMGSDLVKLTPEQQRAAFEAWSSIVRGYQADKK